MSQKVDWKIVTIDTLRMQLKTHLTEFDSWLIEHSYSPNTRKIYLEIIKAAIRKIDPRDDKIWTRYEQGFSKSTLSMRRSVRRTWYKFLGYAIEDKSPIAKLAGTTETVEDMNASKKRLFQRKKASFIRLVSDMILGIELGYIKNSMDELIKEGEKVFEIRKHYKLDLKYVPSEVFNNGMVQENQEELDLNANVEHVSVEAAVPFTEPVEPIETVLTNDDPRLVKLSEILGLTLKDLRALKERAPEQFSSLLVELLDEE